MKRGLGAAWPVALGYFPVAVAFGALGAQAGLSPLWVQLTSLLVFAGASQFALVGLLAQGVPPLLAALLGLLLNLRHARHHAHRLHQPRPDIKAARQRDDTIS